MRLGLIHPGNMGAAIGSALVHQGHTVRWASSGRGPETARRAADSGLIDSHTLDNLSQSELILSVCPPEFALDVARTMAASGFRGLYVDANAVAPATSREIGAIVEAAGATFVDGGIIGPPPSSAGSTRLYLSGAEARAVADLFANTPLDARVVSDQAGVASALKMAYAAWTKGSAALLLTAAAAARMYGVQDYLESEWALSKPGLLDQAKIAAASAATKGWRWVAEMEEVGTTLAAAGLPRGFHIAAAEVFQRAAHDPAAIAGDALLDSILGDLARDADGRSIERKRDPAKSS